METTTNLGLEIGQQALDGGQEGAMKRNLVKIDTALGNLGGSTETPATSVTVTEDGTLPAGDLQTILAGLAARLNTLETAP